MAKRELLRLKSHALRWSWSWFHGPSRGYVGLFSAAPLEASKRSRQNVVDPNVRTPPPSRFRAAFCTLLSRLVLGVTEDPRPLTNFSSVVRLGFGKVWYGTSLSPSVGQGFCLGKLVLQPQTALEDAPTLLPSDRRSGGAPRAARC